MFERRLISALTLAIPAAVAFAVPGWAGGILFLIICAWAIVTMVDEFFTLVEPFAGAAFRRFTALYAFGWVAAIALTQLVPGSTGLHAVSADVAGIFGFLLAAYLRAIFSPNPFDERLRRLFLSLACLLCLIWPLTFLPRLYFSSGPAFPGRLLALFVIVVAKSTDVAAYAVGTLTARLPKGNHKVLPAISPAKSWEGLIGGVLAGAVVAMGMQAVLGQHLTIGGQPATTAMTALLFGAVAGLLGFVGDLGESILKRAAQSKDSGSIPGLGGLLDIVDSLLFTAPAAYILFYITAGQ